MEEDYKDKDESKERCDSMSMVFWGDDFPYMPLPLF